MKGCCATDAEIQDSFQNIKKHIMAGNPALKNFSFGSNSLKSAQCGQVSITEKASKLWLCTRWVNVNQEFKSVEKHLDVGRHLTEQSGHKPVNLCARCNRWWCSINKFMNSCNNRIDCSSPSLKGFELWRRRKIYQIFSTSGVICTRDIFTRRRNRRRCKSRWCCTQNEVSKMSKWTQIVHQGGMTFSCSNC